MSDLPVVHVLDASEARSLTDEVKADAATLWTKLLSLYEGGAHVALGYSSWGAYYEAEFGQGKSHGYRLLDAARAVGSLPDSPMGERPNERQARELARVPEPERAEVWQAAAERAAAEERPVTAADVRAVVEPTPVESLAVVEEAAPESQGDPMQVVLVGEKALERIADGLRWIRHAGGAAALVAAAEAAPTSSFTLGGWRHDVSRHLADLQEFEAALKETGGLRRIK